MSNRAEPRLTLPVPGRAVTRPGTVSHDPGPCPAGLVVSAEYLGVAPLVLPVRTAFQGNLGIGPNWSRCPGGTNPPGSPENRAIGQTSAPRCEIQSICYVPTACSRVYSSKRRSRFVATSSDAVTRFVIAVLYNDFPQSSRCPYGYLFYGAVRCSVSETTGPC